MPLIFNGESPNSDHLPIFCILKKNINIIMNKYLINILMNT